ncbi:hypothetical protein U8527_07605 [Kordia algicida OT-1]|uniref:Uncharacterized protein n=1 Tax=Kordia algicida OT-1 TaxID=391587 RepID=A9E8E4_9FLAO|nr:hypothetical protein [Kordia algicida]EDP94769.1 hypothetical protein KAOT1_01045 [Kordia algicida OT-1]
MKFNRYTFITTGIILITTIAVSLNSCDFFIETEQARTEKETIANNAMTAQKNEAKLLVKASKYNLDVIELCTIIESKDIEEEVKEIVAEIKDEQLDILEKYDKVATENVISIPKYSSIEYQEIKEMIDAEGLEKPLELLSDKISSQKEFVDKLSDTTNNSDFKALAHYANLTLKKSINKTKETIEIINTDS